ncbi:CRISPR-associated protein Cas4 [Methanobrevibacter sp.]|uniref:CRISPR-associated protein Cas4 n=1 Tax=Methanobrevibacter sp. TaxID=66852 RepID=UPI0038683C4F
MLQKNITGYERTYESKEHPSIKGLQIIEGKNNFPISWLNQQGYCEYQIYLEYVEGVETQPTRAMTHGTQIHKELEDIFKKDSTPSTFEDAVEASRTNAIMSRECFVVSSNYGIRGYIDEIWMKPDEIVIIDDKPGRTPYESTMNQVRAYCLAYKDMTGDDRKIKAALRERGTENLFWIEIFTPEVEKEIEFTINRMQGLFDGTKPFMATKNPKKCKSCRFKKDCEHSKD